jgi:hypothetical protein
MTRPAMTEGTLGASFRDPSGFVFESEGVFYRQLKRSYAADYDRLLSSGLYDGLVERGLSETRVIIAESLQGDYTLGRAVTYSIRGCP